MKTIFLFLMMLCFCGASKATNYYVANNGDNTADGLTPETAWETIERVNTAMSTFAPGDSILFKCGDVFRGQLNVTKSGTTALPIVFSKYGTGAYPIISGAKQVNAAAFVNIGGNIWQVSFPDSISYLHTNGVISLLGRHPNTGWLNIDATNGAKAGNATITNSSLNQPANYWNNARIVVRNQNDAITNAKVTSFGSGTLGFVATGYNLSANHGFYLDNKLEALDSDTEWFYNNVTKTLYYYSTTPPTALNLEATVTDHGVQTLWSVHDVVIKNIAVKYQRKDAISTLTSDGGIVIEGCTISNSFDGIFARRTTNVVIKNNTVSDVYNVAIQTSQINGAQIIGNNVSNVSLIQGYEYPILVAGQGLLINGTNIYIAKNTINNIGYSGINYVGQNITIEKNIISNCGLSKNDLGAIQSWGPDTKNNIVRYNFCSGITGNVSGMPAGDGPSAQAIYFDNWQSDNVVTDNVAYNNPDAGGFFFYSTQRQQLTNNTAYNNRIQYSFAERNPNTAPATEVAVGSRRTTETNMQNNIAFSLKKSQRSIATQVDFGTSAGFGIFNNNYYFNPYSGYVASDKPEGWFSYDYSLQGWKNAFNRDANSKEHWQQINEISSATPIGPELIPNGDFTTNINGWSKWQGHVTLTHDAAHPLLGPSLKQVAVTGTESYANIQGSNFAVEAGATYLMRFKVVSNTISSVSVSCGQAESPWSGISTSETFLMDDKVRYHTFLFKPTLTQNPARMLFVTNAPTTYWIDSVSVVKVSDVSYDNAAERNPLFINPSDNVKTIQLTGTYRDLDQNIVAGSITLQPWTSKILVRDNITVLALRDIKFNARLQITNSNYLALCNWKVDKNDLKDVSHFEIERSTDGTDFKAIKRISPTDDFTTNFNATDNTVFIAGDVNYYRLKTTSKQGNIYYSEISALTKKGDLKQSIVFPNPSNGQFTLSHPNALNGAFVKIFNINGQLAFQKTLALGTTQTLFNVTNLTKGNYLLVFNNGKSNDSMMITIN